MREEFAKQGKQCITLTPISPELESPSIESGTLEEFEGFFQKAKAALDAPVDYPRLCQRRQEECKAALKGLSEDKTKTTNHAALSAQLVEIEKRVGTGPKQASADLSNLLDQIGAAKQLNKLPAFLLATGAAVLFLAFAYYWFVHRGKNKRSIEDLVGRDKETGLPVLEAEEGSKI